MIFNSKRRLALLTAAAFFCGVLACNFFLREERAPPSYALTDALPRMGPRPCVAATDAENRQFNAIAESVSAFSNVNASSLMIGAQKQAALGLYRTIDNKSDPICPPADFYVGLARTLEKSHFAFKARLDDYEFEPLAKLRSQNSEWAEAVADVAFSDKPQPGGYNVKSDLRPLALYTLSTFGPLSGKYAERAYSRISIVDSLGTGAAQVAVAEQHPKALSLVSEIAAAEIAKTPEGSTIPRAIKSRLYEMAYAMKLAGPDDIESFDETFGPMLTRKAQSIAPPFGLIDYEPKRLCLIAAMAPLAPRSTLLDHPVCEDVSVLDQ